MVLFFIQALKSHGVLPQKLRLGFGKRLAAFNLSDEAEPTTTSVTANFKLP